MQPTTKTISLLIGSTVFGNNEFIPEKYTCDGDNVSPAITIQSIPSGTKSLALIVDDPDAPNGTFDHWVLWNVRPTELIAENTAPGVQGRNSFGKVSYAGPCPPVGETHRYFFKVYAVDKLLEVPSGSTKQAVVNAMYNHIIAEGEIIGLYKRAE